MANRTVPRVVTSEEVRTGLAGYLREFREHGADAAPVVLGSYRRAEAVLLPIEKFEAMSERLDDLIAFEEVSQALESDTGRRAKLEDVARELGFDSGELGI